MDTGPPSMVNGRYQCVFGQRPSMIQRRSEDPLSTGIISLIQCFSPFQPRDHLPSTYHTICTGQQKPSPRAMKLARPPFGRDARPSARSIRSNDARDFPRALQGDGSPCGEPPIDARPGVARCGFMRIKKSVIDHVWRPDSIYI